MGFRDREAVRSMDAGHQRFRGDEEPHERQVVKFVGVRCLCCESADPDDGEQRRGICEPARKASGAGDSRRRRRRAPGTVGARRRGRAREPAVQRRFDQPSVIVHETTSSAAVDAVLSQRSGRKRRRAIIRRKRTVAAGMPSAVPTSRLVKPTK